MFVEKCHNLYFYTPSICFTLRPHADLIPTHYGSDMDIEMCVDIKGCFSIAIEELL
jgi:hypothetical protein